MAVVYSFAASAPLLFDLPHYWTKVGKKRRRKLDIPATLELLAPYRGCTCAIERVGAMPGQGTVSMFSFGQTYGALLAILASLDIPTHEVTPQAWKRHHGLIGQDKSAAVELANKLYPTLHIPVTRDGRADALLIALYGLAELGAPEGERTSTTVGEAVGTTDGTYFIPSTAALEAAA